MRIFAGAGCDWASTACGAAPIAAAMNAHVRSGRKTGIDSSPSVQRYSGSAAAFVVPADQPAFDQEENPVQAVTEDRKGENPRIHVGHLEGALRQQGEVAQSVVRDDHL